MATRSSRLIEERVAGAYSPTPGVIFGVISPSLTLLDDLGYVTVGAAAEGGNKLHEITAQAQAFLEANRPALDALLARMGERAGQPRATDLPGDGEAEARAAAALGARPAQR